MGIGVRPYRFQPSYVLNPLPSNSFPQEEALKPLTPCFRRTKVYSMYSCKHTSFALVVPSPEGFWQTITTWGIGSKEVNPSGRISTEATAIIGKCMLAEKDFHQVRRGISFFLNPVNLSPPRNPDHTNENAPCACNGTGRFFDPHISLREGGMA